MGMMETGCNLLVSLVATRIEDVRDQRCMSLVMGVAISDVLHVVVMILVTAPVACGHAFGKISVSVSAR